MIYEFVAAKRRVEGDFARQLLYSCRDFCPAYIILRGPVSTTKGVACDKTFVLTHTFKVSPP